MIQVHIARTICDASGLNVYKSSKNWDRYPIADLKGIEKVSNKWKLIWTLN